MAVMCETCKCSIYLEEQADGSMEYGGCENNCPCCNEVFDEWGIKAVFIHNETGDVKYDFYENGEADSENTGIYPAKCGPYESEAEALEAINSWRGDLIAQAATIDTKNEEDLKGYYLDDLVPYLIEKE